MLLEIGVTHLSLFPELKWADEIIKFAPELVAGLGAISLMFKRVRTLSLIPLKYLYNNIPFMKRIAWLESQMVSKNDVLNQLLVGQNEIKSELMSNVGKSLKDSVLNIERSVGKIRAGQKMIFDSTDYGIMELDENGLLITANEKILDWTDRKLEELTGKGFYNIFHPDDRDWVAKQILAAIFDTRIFDIEARIMTNSVYFKVRIVGKHNTTQNKINGYLVTLKKL